jgi:hypothetical protein
VIVLKRGVTFPLDLKDTANRVHGRAQGGMNVLRECQAHLPEISSWRIRDCHPVHIR